MTQLLRLAVVGVGNIGSAFAFQLARAGHEVSVVARPGSARLQQLQRDGGVIDVKGEGAEVAVFAALDEQTSYDLVLVTVLAHQIDAILPALQRCRAACILFMFNTFEPERWRDAIGAERTAFGMPFIQSTLNADGKLRAVIGAMGQKTLLGDQRWVDVFKGAGLPALLEPDMPLWLRCHAPMCVAFESVSVAAMRRGGGASWKEAMTLARGVKECFVLIRAMGYPIYPKGKASMDAGPAWRAAAPLWFMSRIPSFRALLATGINECRALVDAMTAAAAADGSGAPIRRDRIEAMKP